MSDGGKGSTQRPRSIADEEWAERWAAIFNKDEPKKEELVKLAETFKDTTTEKDNE
jgi:hypothetical protein